jgi:cation transport regulator ChaC
MIVKPTQQIGVKLRFRFRLRRAVARSWHLSRWYYRVRGGELVGRPSEWVWYFAYGANMHEPTFRVRRGVEPIETWRARLDGYRLRFNLEGRPKGRAAPANLCPEPGAEVRGVVYRIRRRDLMRLDATEGVPGRGYRHKTVRVEVDSGGLLDAVTYIAEGKENDGRPSLRYITLLRDGARAHELPSDYIRFLDSVEHAV